MRARELVNVIVLPRIFRDSIRLEVWPVPVLDIARLDNQIKQRLGIRAGIHLKGIDRGLKISNLGLGRGDLRLLGAAREFRYYDCGQDAEDDEHQQQLDEGEGALTG